MECSRPNNKKATQWAYIRDLDGPKAHLRSQNSRNAKLSTDFKRLQGENQQHSRLCYMLPHVMLNKTAHPCGGSARPKNDVVPAAPFPALPPYNHDSHRLAPASIVPPFLVSAVGATSSWLRNRRIRYLLILLCSPLLLCLLFFAFPFLCAVDLCLRRCLWRKFFRDSRDDDRLRRCEEGCSGCGGDEEKGLLHRYLEDQLRLVGSMYECGDDEDEEAQEEFRRAQDVENLHSSMTPLLS